MIIDTMIRKVLYFPYFFINKTVDIKDFDSSVPFVNRMINDMKNITTGEDKVILIVLNQVNH